jgi:hypothetical protein
MPRSIPGASVLDGVRKEVERGATRTRNGIN